VTPARFGIRSAVVNPVLVMTIAESGAGDPPAGAGDSPVAMPGGGVARDAGPVPPLVLRVRSDQDKVVLIGMHVAGIPDSETQGGAPPTLDRFGRTIPFLRIQKILDDFIASTP